MLILDLIFVFGLGSTVLGIVKRKDDAGRWLLIGGLLMMVLSFFILSYPEFKEGFVEAVND